MNFKNIDQKIRDGKTAAAWKAIKELRVADLGRKDRADLAYLSIRVRQSDFALKILSRVMKNHREGVEEAHPKEISTYCIALIKLGLLEEAKRWIEFIKLYKDQELAYYDLKVRISIAQWNYTAATYYLKSLLSLVDPKDYYYEVCLLNYSASLLACDKIAEAEKLIKRVQSLSWSRRHRIIYLNSLELQGQLEIKKNLYPQAKKTLERSLNHVGLSDGGIWKFYIKKWMSLIDLKRQGLTEDVQDRFKDLKKEALSYSDFESLRELDRFMAINGERPDLILKVFFGTWFPHYKAKVLADINHQNLCDTYIWSPDGSALTSEIYDYRHHLEQGSKTYRLFEVLLSDFYRPASLGFIFSYLYPEEYYDPFHSKDRVYGIFKGLRSKVEEVSSLDLRWNHLGAHITSSSSLGLVVPENILITKKNQSPESRLRQKYRRKIFRSQDVVIDFGVCQRTAQSWIRAARTKYRVEVFGRGRSLRYKIS